MTRTMSDGAPRPAAATLAFGADKLRRVLILDQPDRDAVASELLLWRSRTTPKWPARGTGDRWDRFLPRDGLSGAGCCLHPAAPSHIRGLARAYFPLGFLLRPL